MNRGTFEVFFTLKVNSATVPILIVLKSLVTVSHWIPESSNVVWENPAIDKQERARSKIIFFITIDMKKLCQTNELFGRYRQKNLQPRF
jgi:hypothetical protein